MASGYATSMRTAQAHASLGVGRMRMGCMLPTVYRRAQASRRGGRCLASSVDANTQTVPGFSDSSLDRFTISIMGDLHLAPEQMHLFEGARSQMVDIMSADPQGARVVQLGDLGHGKHKSGGRSCFEYAEAFISGFRPAKPALILGNHDLEGEEFDDDSENLAAWREVFQQPHFWRAELGPAVLLGISTTRYRSNLNSHHEVNVSEDQVEWLEQQLIEAKNKGQPVIIFSHAPPIGCGLKVLQNVHVKNRCAWLNHSDRPERFIQLVSKYQNVKLWFSGHFHLSHNYSDSISTVGNCAFVQTGVIGDCNRDGTRQSRILQADLHGYKLYTLDHDGDGSLRLDMEHAWSDNAPPVPCIPEDEIVCDPSAGWLCSKVDSVVGEDNAFVRWIPVGEKSILAVQEDQLVEYDMRTSAPIGLVSKVIRGCDVKAVTADGGVPTAPNGSDVHAIEIYDTAAGDTQVIKRNSDGCFYQVYQPNKWRLKKEREALEAQQAVTVAA